MATVQSQLSECHNRPSGFDYMRICLALSIVVWHAAKINYGLDTELHLWTTPLRPLLMIILPMFFALSGFLVSGSLERSRTTAGFLYLRFIRIFPALVVETTISAFIIGPIFTHSSLADYFSDQTFRLYMLNIVGDIHYYLPGVFEANPYPGIVNGQLWTIPFELRCYILAAILSIFGLYRRKTLLVIAFIVLQAIMFQRAYVYGDASGAAVGNVLVLCFMGGMVVYKFRDQIRLSRTYLLVGVCVHILLCLIPYGDYAIAAPDAYITVYLGLLNPPRWKLLQSGDYSYGIYLYSFAIQQAVASMGSWTHTVFVSLLISLPISCLAAVLSWHLVEKHALHARAGTKLVDRLFDIKIPWRTWSLTPRPPVAPPSPAALTSEPVGSASAE